MACAIYDFIVEEDANQPEQTDSAPTEESIDALFDYFADSDIVNTFLNKRSEANSGVANGWKEFSDAKSLIPNSNGVTRWRSGVWELSTYGQKLTNTGLDQSFITVTDTETGNLLRFAFTEGGAITTAKKVGGVYTDTYNSVTVTPLSRYSVIEFTGNGEKIDTELLALVATVDSICANVPRG